MTKEIQDKIESESIFAVENAFAKPFTYPESYCDLYEIGASFGYTLAKEEIEKMNGDLVMAESAAHESIFDLQKEIERLQNIGIGFCSQIEGMRQDADMWIIREKLLEKEIERLKGLIENLWHEIERKDLVYAGMPLTDETIKEIDECWQHFSKENNL